MLHNFRSTPADLFPLSPLDFQVLVVLASKDLYGYAIMKAVEEQSGGFLSPEIGSLYRVLAHLEGTGLVREAAAPETAAGTHRGRPRRYCGITLLGMRVMHAEAERLGRLLDRVRTLLPDRGRP